MKLRHYLSIGVAVVFAGTMINNAVALESDQLPADSLTNAHVKSKLITPHAHLNGQAHARHGIPFIDSLVNWNDHYFADGFDSLGNPNREWYTNTVGNPPQHKGTTLINAPIVPVIMDLRNADGTTRNLVSNPAAFVQPVLDSPVFSNAVWTSSPVPTQITDAVQRAEYFDQAKDDWHTLLGPSVKPARRMVINQSPTGQPPVYIFSLNPDGSCCRFILVEINTFVNALFPATATDTTTPVGAAENAGDITTKDMSTFLFPNVFLYEGTRANCCVIGFHTYDFEPADPNTNNTEKRYVMNYSSWISPGIFGGGFQDVTALSHEIAETYNDPFVTSDGVHNITPWWSSDGQCQNALETGDVIEGLANPTFPTLMPNGFTYHPQTEALLPWFQRQFPSSAIHGAYSYPNESVLPNLSPPNLKPADCGF
jgi:hypothetical protein